MGFFFLNIDRRERIRANVDVRKPAGEPATSDKTKRSAPQLIAKQQRSKKNAFICGCFVRVDNCD